VDCTTGFVSVARIHNLDISVSSTKRAASGRIVDVLQANSLCAVNRTLTDAEPHKSELSVDLQVRSVTNKGSWIFSSLSSLLLWGQPVLCAAPSESHATPSRASDVMSSDQKEGLKKEVLTPLTVDDKYLREEIPQATGKEPLTLRGAVSEALISNREIKESALEVSRFKWASIASEVNRLPNLRVLGYLGQQTTASPLIPARADAFYFMSFLFPITQQYRIGLESHALKLAQNIALESLRKRSDEVRAEVKGAYYKLALDRSHLDDVEESIRYLKELDATVMQRIKEGSSLKVEQMQVTARLAKAYYERSKALNEYSVDVEKLNHLLGRKLDNKTEIEIIPPPEFMEINLPQAQQLALDSRAEIRQAVSRAKQANLEKKILMSEYIPNVSIGAVYLGLPGFNNQILPKNVFAPGIFINYNAFDWGRKAFIAKSKSKVEQGAQLAAQSVRDDVMIDVHAQFNKLSESRQLIATASLSRGASREELRVETNRYKNTAATFAEVMQAHSSLAEANENYHQALLSFWQAKAQFERAVGSNE
jgi:outer membrane protein